MIELDMKSGIASLLGRPNVGKSTLVNNLIGQKVAITSPKPQTTRFPIQAVYEDERGQIIFVDTPGVFLRAPDILTKKINPQAEEANKDVDLILYIIDHTRPRAAEENRTLGIARKIKKPKILVINKTDIKEPSYLVDYKFMEEEFDDKIEISALHHKNLNYLLDKIFQYLPEGKPQIDTKSLIYPVLNMDSRAFVAEIIREKAFLFLREELPYKLTTKVEEIEERENGVVYIKAKIVTSDHHYKKMIIGQNARMIKKIGMNARKELEVATGKKIYLDLEIEVDPHWMETF